MGPPAPATDADSLDVVPVTGPETITVPGLVAGWDALHRRCAASAWASAIDPAIALARDGVPIAPGLADAIAEAAATGALTDPGMASVFAPRGTPLSTGDVLVQPALGQTLEELARSGAAAFYRGAIADRLLAGLAPLGSRLRAADLAAFAPEETAPIRTSLRDVEVLTSPPNSSGVLLLQALAALDAAVLADPLGTDAAMLARIFHAGARERDRLLGDPRDSAMSLDDWLGPEAIAAALADRGHTTATAPRPTGDTVAVVAVDADGRAVSLIQSLFNSFGARILEPRTGVLLHNRGAMFSLEPDHPNALAPGRRPAHTLMPVLVERGGDLLGVLGTMGGKVHAQIHVQVLLRLLSGLPAQAAVDAPRWIVGGMEVGEPDDTIRIEDGRAEPTRQALGAAGLRLIGVPRGSDWLGHAQAIWLAAGTSVGTDFRADP
jgi:gamma-glutamyltranspeptidase